MKAHSRTTQARVGDSVRVIAVPTDLKTMPRETKRVFSLVVGHQFKVRGRNQIGWLELMVDRVVGPVVGRAHHTIWIEPECVRVVRRKSGAA